MAGETVLKRRHSRKDIRNGDVEGGSMYVLLWKTSMVETGCLEVSGTQNGNNIIAEMVSSESL